MEKYGAKGYKAFYYGMTCKGKKYAENTVFEELGAKECCKAGVMHYCENPLDVLNYYPLVDAEGHIVEVAEVEPQADVLRKGDKCATKKLKIGAKLSFKEYIKASINFVFEACKADKNDGDFAKLASSGNSAKLASSGYSAQLASSGKNAVVAAIGANSIAKGALGNWIVLAEWDIDENNNLMPKHVKAIQVDGDNIKANTWYQLKEGEFVEVEA